MNAHEPSDRAPDAAHGREKLSAAERAFVDECLRDLNRFETLERAIDASLPQVAPVDAGLRNSKTGGTNPASFAVATASARGIDPALRKLTPVDPRLRNSQSCRTKPTPAGAATAVARSAPADLSPRQLAAARMIARGAKPADVAAALKITRQGLWRWRRMPAFVAEIWRLHEILVRPAQHVVRH